MPHPVMPKGRPENFNEFTIPDDPAKSRFRFILVAADRARQIRETGSQILPGRRPEKVAMEEVRRGLVRWSGDGSALAQDTTRGNEQPAKRLRPVIADNESGNPAHAGR